MKNFRDAARNRDFVISAELFLKPDSTAETLGLQADLLKEHVDAVLLTDNQGGKLHMSPVAAASLVLAHDVDAIVQLGGRNRNRIALLAELLGAAAIGVTSVQLVRGNRVPDGFQPRPKAVHDVDPGELIGMASRFKGEEGLVHMPELYIGSDFTVHKPAPDWAPTKLMNRSANGAQFVISNMCMNLKLLRKYMSRAVAEGVPRELNVHVSIAVPASAADARWLKEARPNNLVPAALIKRLEQAPDAEQEGVKVAAEILNELRTIPGISGAHLVATQNLALIPAAIQAAAL